MKTRIVVDSTADILPEYLDQIHTVPLTVSFGEEEYIDGVTIDHRTFYQKLIETDAMPSTSQASPAAFAEQYDQAAAADEEVVVITISSKLSGTYQSAMIAAAGRSSVYIVDSENASVGCGILVGLALRYLRDGMTASAIAEKLQEDKKKIVVIALLDTLEYLKRGGRISKAAAFAGGLLNIKPVISIADGEIQLLGKARGSKMGNNLLAQQIQKVGGIDFTKPVLLGYTGLSDVLLQKYIEDSSYLWSASLDAVRYVSIGSVIGAHAGPGAIAVAFFRK
ncbi:MAG: DegV family protein [Clostridia bacterium]|nr:MAG: DegV family protein [Clostridia bacterium]